MKKLVNIQLEQVKNRLLEKQIQLQFDSKVQDFLMKKGYDPQFGARPLKRTIQNEFLNPLSRQIIGGKIPPDSTVQVTSHDSGLEFC